MHVRARKIIDRVARRANIAQRDMEWLLNQYVRSQARLSFVKKNLEIAKVTLDFGLVNRALDSLKQVA